MKTVALSVPLKEGPDGQAQLHASTVVLDGKAVAFLGPSGSGKSTAALGLIAQGASLLADDVTWVTLQGDQLIADCPEPIQGQIEARGVGLLQSPYFGPAPLHLIVDLGTPERDRIPDHLNAILLGHSIPLLRKPENPHFINAIALYMLHGRID